MSALHPVPTDFAARTRIGAMDYEKLYAESVRDPDGFWQMRSDCYEHAIARRSLDELERFYSLLFTPGKNFPATGGFGPWMVTADEIAPGRALKLETRLNDRRYDFLLRPFEQANRNPDLAPHFRHGMRPGDLSMSASDPSTPSTRISPNSSAALRATYHCSSSSACISIEMPLPSATMASK